MDNKPEELTPEELDSILAYLLPQIGKFPISALAKKLKDAVENKTPPGEELTNAELEELARIAPIYTTARQSLKQEQILKDQKIVLDRMDDQSRAMFWLTIAILVATIVQIIIVLFRQ